MKEPSPTSRAPSPSDDAVAVSDASPTPVVEAESSDAGSADASTTLRVVDIRNASKLYDFRVTMRGDCTQEDSLGGATCEGPGSVVVFRKGARVPLQQEDFDALELVREKGATLVNTSTLYDYQGTINVGDFDFDGHEDFAVQGPHTGPYGGPTFSVFLYSAGVGKFVRSSAFSELTETTLGFFQVDTKSKRVVTLSKSGCCYHETTQYEVVDGGLVRTDVVIEDGFGEEDASVPLPPNTILLTHGRLVGGKWVTTKKTAPAKTAAE
jgi:hypothetical protein